MRVLKWIGVLLGGAIILLVLAATVLVVVGGARFNKTHNIQAEAIILPTDEAALARGEHLVNVGCKSCHGADLSGQPMIDDPPIGTVYAANITGLASTHSDEDLVRAIRHGVDTDGRQLMIMPAEAFIHFSEEDLGSIIAYLKTLPRSGDDLPGTRLAPLGRILLGAGLFGNVFPAEYIDHELPFPEMPEIGANKVYGGYIVELCTGCHGMDLAGDQPPDPESPPAPNLTPGGELQTWTEEDFIQAIRTGTTLDGRVLDPAFMPWPSFGKFDDEELQALWMYLRSIPAVQDAED